MKQLATSTMLLALLWSAANTRAQSYNYNWQGKASTVGESRARGVADIIRAAGDTNLRNSEAAINYEDARSADLDNRLKYAETYFAKRQINQEYRDANRRPAPTAEQLFRRSKSSLPKRLRPTQYDPVSGKIQWPPLLMDKRFSADRKELDKMFHSLAEKGRLGIDDQTQVERTGESMSQSLQKVIRAVPSRDYIQASNFIKSLTFEARQGSG